MGLLSFWSSFLFFCLLVNLRQSQDFVENFTSYGSRRLQQIPSQLKKSSVQLTLNSNLSDKDWLQILYQSCCLVEPQKKAPPLPFLPCLFKNISGFSDLEISHTELATHLSKRNLEVDRAGLCCFRKATNLSRRSSAEAVISLKLSLMYKMIQSSSPACLQYDIGAVIYSDRTQKKHSGVFSTRALQTDRTSSIKDVPMRRRF